MTFTSGYELSTALTNLMIFIVSFYGIFKIKNDKLWKMFFILMSIDSLLGFIVHGFVMTLTTNIILWIILSIFFTITVNTLLVIFLKTKIKYIFILSIILAIVLLLEMYFGIDFIFTFTMYVLLTLIISVYKLYKSKIKDKKLYYLAFISELTGGVLMLSKIKFLGLNHNGYCHIFLAISMLLFLIRVTKKNS